MRALLRVLVWVTVASATLGPTAIASSGPLKLARPFTDNAVFQRGQTFPVFGVDAPGTNVSVTFAGQTLSTVSDTNGHWRVNLAPLALNATPQLLAVTGSSVVTLTNIFVGDVWLISGQSNADFPLRSAIGSSAAIASATNTLIRYLHLAESPRTDAVAWSPAEVSRLNLNDYFSGAWQVNDPSSVGAMSAVGYFFARHIQSSQNVPIGLIDCTVGGTRAESWMPADAINAHPRLAAIADDFLNSDMVAPFAKTRLLQNLAHWNSAGRPAPMPEHPYKPGACWRNGLGTLAPFALRGVLWYQGETDADFSNPADFELMARWHTDVFKTLVAAWRRSWENPTLPVYFVQLPQMNRPSWPWFRESQRQCVLTISNTAMAVAYEYGEANNVHPANKRPVGDRLALIARACSYGENVEWSGPTLRSWSTHSNRLVLQFDHATGGLVSSDAQPLRLFQVAGKNGHFFSATAIISSNAVILYAPGVLQPVAARYAWSPAGSINFYNGADLPASPFRTDDD